jgi:hypothetical protein
MDPLSAATAGIWSEQESTFITSDTADDNIPIRAEFLLQPLRLHIADSA